MCVVLAHGYRIRVISTGLLLSKIMSAVNMSGNACDGRCIRTTYKLVRVESHCAQDTFGTIETLAKLIPRNVQANAPSVLSRG